MAVAHPPPFRYEDTDESSIQSMIARFNKADPSGKLNGLCIPPRRVEQSRRRPKWYSPSSHASAPYLSVSIAQTSSTLAPSVPLTLTITLHHHPSPTGNPSSQPVTFQLKDTHLTTIDPVEFFPWLLLHHDPHALKGGLKEIEGDKTEGHRPAALWEGHSEDTGPDTHVTRIDAREFFPWLLQHHDPPVEGQLEEIEGDQSEGHGPAVPGEGLSNATDPSSSASQKQQPLVSPENGFVTLAVGQSKTVETEFRPKSGLVKRGERYEICFRGLGIKWWRLGSVEELEAAGVRKIDGEREEGGAKGMIKVPCSNLVRFVVEGGA